MAITIMARRVGWYFVVVGIALLAIAFVLAAGSQSSGRMLLGGLGSVAVGAWLVMRSASAAPATPPPVVQAKVSSKPPAPAQAKSPAAPAEARPASKPKGLAGLFKPKSKSRT